MWSLNWTDLILEAIAARSSEIYCLVYSAYSCESVLSYGDWEILSREGAQQGDPFGSLQFCEALHPLLCDLQSAMKIGFMDDVTLSGSLQSVEQDVITIMDAASKTGLQLNTAKCEVIMKDFTAIPTSSVLNSFVKVEKDEMTLLGSLVLKGTAQVAAISHKINELKTAVDRLSLLHSNDALVLPKIVVHTQDFRLQRQPSAGTVRQHS